MSETATVETKSQKSQKTQQPKTIINPNGTVAAFALSSEGRCREYLTRLAEEAGVSYDANAMSDFLMSVAKPNGHPESTTFTKATEDFLGGNQTSARNNIAKMFIQFLQDLNYGIEAEEYAAAIAKEKAEKAANKSTRPRRNPLIVVEETARRRLGRSWRLQNGKQPQGRISDEEREAQQEYVEKHLKPAMNKIGKELYLDFTVPSDWTPQLVNE